MRQPAGGASCDRSHTGENVRWKGTRERTFGERTAGRRWTRPRPAVPSCGRSVTGETDEHDIRITVGRLPASGPAGGDAPHTGRVGIEGGTLASGPFGRLGPVCDQEVRGPGRGSPCMFGFGVPPNLEVSCQGDGAAHRPAFATVQHGGHGQPSRHGHHRRPPLWLDVHRPTIVRSPSSTRRPGSQARAWPPRFVVAVPACSLRDRRVLRAMFRRRRLVLRPGAGFGGRRDPVACPRSASPRPPGRPV